jgi:hypothetical protein
VLPPIQKNRGHQPPLARRRIFVAKGLGPHEQSHEFRVWIDQAPHDQSGLAAEFPKIARLTLHVPQGQNHAPSYLGALRAFSFSISYSANSGSDSLLVSLDLIEYIADDSIGIVTGTANRIGARATNRRSTTTSLVNEFQNFVRRGSSRRT